METMNVYSVPIDMGRVTSAQSDSMAHKGDMIHATDFDAPEGTDVFSACDGLVLAVKDDSTTGGEDPSFEDEGNYIEILHDHNEVSEYEHLLVRSAVVKVGDRVVRGAKIAEVGNTG